MEWSDHTGSAALPVPHLRALIELQVSVPVVTVVTG